MKKALLITLVTIFWASCAQAQPPHPQTSMKDVPPPPQRGLHGPQERGPKQGHRGLELKDLDRIREHLDLQPEQVDAMRELLFESGKERLTREGKVRVLEFTIRALMMEDEPSLHELRELHEELSLQKAAIGWSRIEAEFAMKGILSPEQQRKLRTRPRHQRPNRPQHPRAHAERPFPGPPNQHTGPGSHPPDPPKF